VVDIPLRRYKSILLSLAFISLCMRTLHNSSWGMGRSISYYFGCSDRFAVYSFGCPVFKIFVVVNNLLLVHVSCF
jgi:hypothetical protein